MLTSCQQETTLEGQEPYGAHPVAEHRGAISGDTGLISERGL